MPKKKNKSKSKSEASTAETSANAAGEPSAASQEQLLVEAHQAVDASNAIAAEDEGSRTDVQVAPSAEMPESEDVIDNETIENVAGVDVVQRSQERDSLDGGLDDQREAWPSEQPTSDAPALTDQLQSGHVYNSAEEAARERNGAEDGIPQLLRGGHSEDRGEEEEQADNEGGRPDDEQYQSDDDRIQEQPDDEQRPDNDQRPDDEQSQSDDDRIQEQPDDEQSEGGEEAEAGEEETLDPQGGGPPDEVLEGQEHIPEDGWVLYQTADGHDYYYNHHTGESQWASTEHGDYSYEQHQEYLQQQGTEYDYSDSSYHQDDGSYASPQRLSTHPHSQYSQHPPDLYDAYPPQPSPPRQQQQQQFYNPSSIRSPHPAAPVHWQQPPPAQRPPAVTFYQVPPQPQRNPGYSGEMYHHHHHQQQQEELDVGDYEAERLQWDQDAHHAREPDRAYSEGAHGYDEEAGDGDYEEGNYASDEDDDFDEKFAVYLQSSAGQRALEEEKSRLERKAARIAKKKLREEARQVWLHARGKEKESDDDGDAGPVSGGEGRRDRRVSSRLSQRPQRERRRSHWEVDDAEQGMSYFSGRDAGSGSSVVSSATTSTDDDDVSSDDSDVETILAPTLPPQLTSTNAALETLRPFQLFIFRFVEVGVEVTKEIAGTVWTHTSLAAQQVTETAANYALDALSKSIEVIQRRGGETYAKLNDVIVEFVEADIEHHSQAQASLPGASDNGIFTETESVSIKMAELPRHGDLGDAETNNVQVVVQSELEGGNEILQSAEILQVDIPERPCSTGAA